MLGRLLTGLRTALRRDGGAERSPRAGSEGDDPVGAPADEPAPGFVVCEGCDTTFIATWMAGCPRCGATVLPEREADPERESFV